MQRITGFSLLLSASVFALGAPAFGQEADAEEIDLDDIEEIVVTARRREENVKDVPNTVSVLSRQELQSAGVERAEDFIDLVAGVTLVNTAEVGDTQVNIRGINATRDAEASFAFLIDGILYSNPSSFNREFTNLRQIEVVKGPQGAIYGRNAAAGAIIVTTDEPGEDYEAELTIAGGNNSLIVGRARMSGPVIENYLYGQISADFRSTDGFFRNSFQNDDVVDDFQNFNINSRWIYTPSDNVQLDVKTRYGEVDAGAITFNSIFHLPAFVNGFGFPIPEFAEDVNDHDFVFNGNIDPQNDQRTIEVSAKLDWDFEWASLTTWGLFSDIDQSFSADGTSAAFNFFVTQERCEVTTAQLNEAGFVLPAPQVLGETPLPLAAGIANGSLFGAYTPTACDGIQFQVRDQQDISFEARLASPGDQRLRWEVGAYFLDIDRQVGVNLGLDDGFGVTERLFVPQGLPNATEQLIADDFDNRVFAVFGQAAYDLTDALEVSAALRYDNERREVQSLVPVGPTSQFIDFDGDFVFAGGAPLNPGLDPNLNPDGLGSDREIFEHLQPKVSLTYDLPSNDFFDATAFASWGIGFKSGGFNNSGSAATVDAFINGTIQAVFPEGGFFPAPTEEDLVNISDSFREETSNAYEIGVKSTMFSGLVDFEAAGYFTDVDDLQFFEFFVGPFGLLRVVSNVDRVLIYGFEASAGVNPIEGLDVRAAFNLTESEIRRNSSRPNTIGNESPGTPDYTFNGTVQYRQPFLGGYEGLIRFDANLIGPTYFHTVQDQPSFSIFGAPADNGLTERDTYFTLDLRVGVEGENWSLVGFVENLTDENFLAEVINAPEFGGSFAAPGALRSFGGEFTFRF